MVYRKKKEKKRLQKAIRQQQNPDSDLEAKFGHLEYTREFGNNAFTVMTEDVGSDDYMNVIEPANNAHDADAENCWITIDIKNPELEERILIIEDDGSGMEPHEVKTYCKTAEKVKEGFTPIFHRPYQGKKGVASLGLKKVGTSMELRTVKRKTNIETCLEDDFPTEDSPDRKLKRSWRRIKKPEDSVMRGKKNGTKIIVRGVTLETASFSMDKLKRKLQWEVPMSSNFHVYLNGEEIRSKSIEKSRRFVIEGDVPGVGIVKGFGHYTSGKSNIPGFHVHVKGRRYDNPQDLVDTGAGLSLANKMVITVDADGMESAILKDRNVFSRSSPKTKALINFLKAEAGKIRAYDTYVSKTDRATKINSSIEATVASLRKRLVAAGVIPKSVNIIPDDTLDKNTSSNFLVGKKTYVINTNLPILGITSKINAVKYEERLLTEIIETIAIAQTGSRISVGNVLPVKNGIWEKLAVKEALKIDEAKIFDNVLYSPAELASYAGRDIGEIRYLIDGGVLTPILEDHFFNADLSKDRLVKGGEFLRLEEKLSDLMSLYDFVSQTYAGAESTNVKRVTELLDQVGKEVEPFIFNLGTNGNSCYMFEKICMGDIQEIMMKSRPESFKKRTRELESVMLTSDDLAYLFGDEGDEKYRQERIKEVLAYSRTNELKIESTGRKSGGAVQYKYGDFVRVMQAMRD